jgi:hypothetical protein
LAALGLEGRPRKALEAAGLTTRSAIEAYIDQHGDLMPLADIDEIHQQVIVDALATSREVAAEEAADHEPEIAEDGGPLPAGELAEQQLEELAKKQLLAAADELVYEAAAEMQKTAHQLGAAVKQWQAQFAQDIPDDPGQRMVIALTRDKVINHVPKGIGTRLATIHLEPGMTLDLLLLLLNQGIAGQRRTQD